MEKKMNKADCYKTVWVGWMMLDVIKDGSIIGTILLIILYLAIVAIVEKIADDDKPEQEQELQQKALPRDSVCH